MLNLHIGTVYIHLKRIQNRVETRDPEETILRDPNSKNILLFERIIPGQGSDGTSYITGDLHTIEYEDGYFDYEEGGELNAIINREFTEF